MAQPQRDVVNGGLYARLAADFIAKGALNKIKVTTGQVGRCRFSVG